MASSSKKPRCTSCGGTPTQGEMLCETCSSFNKRYFSNAPVPEKSTKSKKGLSQSSPGVISKSAEKRTAMGSPDVEELRHHKKKQNFKYQVCLDLIAATELYPNSVQNPEQTDEVHKIYHENGFQFCKVSDKFGNLILYHEHQDQDIKNTRVYYCLSKDSHLCSDCQKFLQVKTFPNLYFSIKPKACIYSDNIKM